ncbi:hypothetical protein CEE45_12425 [Candidatus Heimdallarchaeota archaeon B3_Heim]|nr:MAG: hypothetical protein CEE45_12425 [Candidatus Heimdallarchaeota archaeon B3_Heim]
MSSEENMQWKQREKQSEEQREKIDEIEEKLLAEGPYEDQIVIDEETKDNLLLSPREEITERPIDDKEEQSIEEYAQRGNQKEEIKEREASLVTMAKEGFNDQQVLHDEVTESKLVSLQEGLSREHTEEEMKWKQEEEHLEEQINDHSEKFRKEKEILHSEDKYLDQIEERVQEGEKIDESLQIGNSHNNDKYAPLTSQEGNEKRLLPLSEKKSLRTGQKDIQVKKQNIEDEGENCSKQETSLEKNQKRSSTDVQEKEKAFNKQKHVNQLISEVNTQLQSKIPIDSQIYNKLAEFSATGTYPNLSFVYKKDNQRSLQLLDEKVFNQLIKNQNKPGFRLEWHRDWFTGFEKKTNAKNQRRLFLLDLTKNQVAELPSDMKRVWVIKNEPKWNYFSPTKRELHGNSLNDLMNILFGKRNKFSVFTGVTRHSYEKAMRQIWNEFQSVFASEIRLKAKNRPAIKALKPNYSKKAIEYSLIGSFWHYYNNLSRKGKNDLEKGGYKSLVKFLQNYAPKIIPLTTDRYHQINKPDVAKKQVRAKGNKVVNEQGSNERRNKRFFRKEDSNSVKVNLDTILERLHLNSKIFNYDDNSQRNFVKAWNKFVDSKNKPSIDMWRIYNKIQRQCDSPLLYIHRKDDHPRLRLKKDIKEAEILHDKTIAAFPNLKNTTLIAEWLKFSQKIDGKNPLIEVRIKNPLTLEEELWLIRNKNSVWNPEGLPFKNNSAEKRFVSSEFFEKWQFSREKSSIIKLGEIEGYMPYSIKKSILNALFSETSIPNGAVFQQAYKLRISPETIDNFFEKLWNEERKTIKQIDKTRPILLRLKEYYMERKVDDSVVTIDIKENFDVFLFDKSSSLFKHLFSELQEIADYYKAECKNLEQWWELIGSKITVKELAKSLLKATYIAPIKKTAICYQFSEATTSRFGPLTIDPVRFWSETYNNGFSGLAAALMENQEVRELLVNFTNKDTDLSPLNLSKAVFTEMTGHDTVSPEHLIPLPDGITKIGHIGSDVFQNKLLRPIGKNKNEINAEIYLLDWLKTAGNYDPINYSINNLQLEFIPSGVSLNGLTNIAKDHNAIIISYWGNTVEEIGRFMEVISAIHVINFKRQKKQNFSEEELKELVIQNLEKRTHSGMKISQTDSPTTRIIDQFLPEAIRAKGEGTFLKNSVIKLLSYYGDKLFSDYYPIFPKE